MSTLEQVNAVFDAAELAMECAIISRLRTNGRVLPGESLGVFKHRWPNGDEMVIHMQMPDYAKRGQHAS